MYDKLKTIFQKVYNFCVSDFGIKMFSLLTQKINSWEECCRIPTPPNEYNSWPKKNVNMKKIKGIQQD